MGAFIDNEIPPERAHILPLSHAAGYEAVPRTRLVALADLRPDVLERAGQRYGVAKEHQYTDYREMIVRERPDIVSIATQPEGRADIIRFVRSEEHTSELQSRENLVCRLLLEKKKNQQESTLR